MENKKAMRKYFYIGTVIVLSLLNNEVLSWLVLGIISIVWLCRVFPDLMEGTK